MIFEDRSLIQKHDPHPGLQKGPQSDVILVVKTERRPPDSRLPEKDIFAGGEKDQFERTFQGHILRSFQSADMPQVGQADRDAGFVGDFRLFPVKDRFHTQAQVNHRLPFLEKLNILEVNRDAPEQIIADDEIEIKAAGESHPGFVILTVYPGRTQVVDAQSHPEMGLMPLKSLFDQITRAAGGQG